MSRPLYILGAGGHGRVLADAATSSGLWRPIRFLDDRWPALSDVDGCLVVGDTQQLEALPRDAMYIVGIGHNTTRFTLTQRLAAAGLTLATVVHARAVLSPLASVEPGSLLCATAVVNAGAKLGTAVIVNTGAIVEHDCTIGDGTHICPGVRMAGGVRVGACTWVGIGATLIEGVTIGDNCTLGAGTVVVKDVPVGVTVVGNPARVIKR